MSHGLPRRVDRALREALALSRARAEEVVRGRRVAIETPDGIEPALFPDTLLFPSDRLLVDGLHVEAVASRSAGAGDVWMLHKPAGVVTTLSDPAGRPSVAAWTSRLGAGFFPVGRLDAATTGLLLLTEDGDLAHLLLHPRHHIPKTYVLTVRGAVVSDDPRIQALRDGVTLHDGPARALEADVVGEGPPLARPGGPTEPTTTLKVVIDVGRKRIVRRMAATVRFDLLALHRSHIGALSLGALEPGGQRELDVAEHALLWADFGGPRAVAAAQVAALRRLLGRWDTQGRSEGEAGRRRDRLAAWLATYDA